jgi:hypothetical protein
MTRATTLTGAMARTGRARPRKSHKPRVRERSLLTAAAVQAADQRSEAAVIKRKKAK